MAKRKLNPDYQQEIFFAERLNQTGYDREIDEGMSSGMRRYATLDVTSLNERQITGLLEGLLDQTEDFKMCKLIQVAGFNKEGARYLTISGESHAMYQGSARDMMLERVRSITTKLPVKYAEANVTPPEQGKPYQPTNLGPYGSTGNPSLGIPQHPDAHKPYK